MGDHVRRARLWTQHGGIHRLGMFGACLGKRCSSGTVMILAKEGGQLALEDTSSDGIISEAGHIT